MTDINVNQLATAEELAGFFDVFEPSDWRDLAACAGTDTAAFFPEVGGSTRVAKRICQGCEVRAECLDYALTANERFGIFGGLSELDRRKLKRQAAPGRVSTPMSPHAVEILRLHATDNTQTAA